MYSLHIDVNECLIRDKFMPGGLLHKKPQGVKYSA